MTTAIIVMTNVPLPGRTKSRLQQRISPVEAALFHRACLYDLLMVLRTGALPVRIFVRGSAAEFCAPFPHAPPEEFSALAQLNCSDFTLCQQQGRDLGERMLFAVQESLQEFQQVLLIGSDIPGIGNGLLHQAFHELEDHDLVLGPAHDGGYYLIGLKQTYPELFSEIAWGSELVLAQTLKKAHKSGLRTVLLPGLQDIDTWNDLEKFVASPGYHLDETSIDGPGMAWRYAHHLDQSLREKQEGERK